MVLFGIQTYSCLILLFSIASIAELKPSQSVSSVDWGSDDYKVLYRGISVYWGSVSVS